MNAADSSHEDRRAGGPYPPDAKEADSSHDGVPCPCHPTDHRW